MQKQVKSMSSATPRTGEYSSDPHVVNNEPSKGKTIGFAIVIILGLLSGLAVAGVGLGGYLQAGSLSSLGQVNSIIMMAAGGGGGVIFLIVGIVGFVKNCQRSGDIHSQSTRHYPSSNIKKPKYSEKSSTWETAGKTRLHRAVMDFHNVPGVYSAAKQLIDEGADVNAKDSAGWTPLHDVACSSHHKYSTVRLLIKNGAEVNARTLNNDTPLHMASGVSSRYFLTVKILLENSAEVDARNSEEQTPLHRASSELFSQPFIVELLLNHGADIQARDSQGQTPLHLACNAGNNYIIEYLVDSGANVNAQDSAGRTPLHLACDFGNFFIIKYLIDHGADLKATDFAGRIPQIPPTFDRNKGIPTPDPFNYFTNEFIIGRAQGFSEPLLTDKDPHEILGVAKTASREEIKTAFKKLALHYHPDKIYQEEGEENKTFKQRQAANEEKFKDVHKAYKKLM